MCKIMLMKQNQNQIELKKFLKIVLLEELKVLTLIQLLNLKFLKEVRYKVPTQDSKPLLKKKKKKKPMRNVLV